MRFSTILRALAVALIVAIPLAQSEPAFAASPINGGGSGFAALEIDQWRADTARAPYSLKVDYVAQGSSFGRGQFASGNLDFGASDIKYPAFENASLSPRCGSKSPADCFAYVPVSAGGLAFMYNLVDSGGGRVNSLKLSRTTACKIFTGAITKWNDPAIVADNPGLNVSGDIVPVIRADGAGESYVLSEFCIAVAPDVWQAFIAERKQHDAANIGDDFKNGEPVSNWPQNWGRSNPVAFADGTANTVADPNTGKNAITYVAAGYAKVRSNFPVASLQNAAGKFTQPDEDNVTVALGYAKGNGDGTFTLDFTGADERAYFPSTYSYILAQTAGFDAGKGATLGQFLCYAVSKGQEIAPSLRYARLSKPLVDLAIAQIHKIPGAPGDSCFIQSASAPPPPPSVAPGSATPPPDSSSGGGSGPTTGTTGTTPGGTSGTTGTTPGGTTATTPGGTTTTGNSGTSVPCTSTTTTSTTSPGGTTTSSTSTTTTTVAGAPTTTKPATTTTVPCTTATDASSQVNADGTVSAQGASADLLLAAEAASSQPKSTQNNGLWALLAGMGLCAVLTVVADWRRGVSQ